MRRVVLGLTLLGLAATGAPAQGAPVALSAPAIYKMVATWSTGANEGGPHFDWHGSLALVGHPPSPCKCPASGAISMFSRFFVPTEPIIPTEPVRFARGGILVNWSDGTVTSVAKYTMLLVGLPTDPIHPPNPCLWFGKVTFGRFLGGTVIGNGTTSTPPNPISPSSGTFTGEFEVIPAAN